jgi:hypothetical protein
MAQRWKEHLNSFKDVLSAKMKTCTAYRNLIAATIASIYLVFVMAGFIPYSHGEVGSNNNVSNMLYPLNSEPFGIGYIAAAEGFHRLLYMEPSGTNIATDTNGKYCSLDQSGPIWYLAGTAGGSVVRNCTIPAGKALFFPLIANECSYAENPNLKSVSQLIDCAKSADNNLNYLQLSIDGVTIPNMEKYRITSTKLFNFTFVKDNIAGTPPGQTSGAIDGWFAYLKPLPPGSDTVRFGGASTSVTLGQPNYAVDATYHLTVS